MLNYVIPTQPEAPQRQPGLGEMLASSFGQGLGQGLGEGVQSTMKQIMHQKIIDRALGSLPRNASAREIFNVASQLPPEAQEIFVKTYIPARRDEMEYQAKAQAEQTKRENENKLLGQQILMAHGYGPMGETGAEEEETAPEQAMEEKTSESAIDQAIGRRQNKEIKTGRLLNFLENSSPEEKASYLKNLQAQKKEDIEREKINAQKTRASIALNKDFINSTLKEGSRFERQKFDIDRMRQLDAKGKIDTAWKTKLSDFFGVRDILSADTQELEKIALNQQERLKEIYGARPTNIDVINFNKTIPSLYQSAEGRQRIYDYMQFVNNAAKVKYDAYREIMKGREFPPGNIQEMVEDRASERLAKLADDFNRKTDNEFSETPEKETETGEIPPTIKKKPPIPPKGKTGTTEPKEESALMKGGKEVLRHGARIGTRLAEEGHGFVGNVAELAKNSIEYLNEKFPVTKKMPSLNDVHRGMQTIRKFFPTSSELRKVSNELTGGYTEPKSKVEDAADNLITSAASMYMMGGASIPRAIGVATSGELAKAGADLFNTAPSTKKKLYIGATILSSIWDPKRATNLKNALYDETESLLPHDAKILGTDLLEDIARTEDRITRKGVLSKGDDLALTQLNKLKNVVDKNGEINVNSLWESKKNLNDKYFELAPKERIDLDPVKKIIHENFNEYGKYNPKFLSKLKAADNANAILLQSKKAADTIVKAWKQAGVKIPDTIKFAGLGIPYLAPKATGFAAIPAIAAYGSFKTGEIGYRFMKNPSFRRSYNKMMISAVKGNVAATAHNLQQMNEIAKQENKKQKK